MSSKIDMKNFCPLPWTEVYIAHDTTGPCCINTELYNSTDVTDYLKSKDYLLGCVTNKAEQFTLPLLQSLGIIDYFGIVISGDTLEKKKPDPLPLIHGANFFNIKPNFIC